MQALHSASSSGRVRGGIRHLDTRLLWIQERAVKEDIGFEKIGGSLNPADLGTKFLDEPAIRGHMNRLRLAWVPGRPPAAPGVTQWGPQPWDVLHEVGNFNSEVGGPSLARTAGGAAVP